MTPTRPRMTSERHRYDHERPRKDHDRDALGYVDESISERPRRDHERLPIDLVTTTTSNIVLTGDAATAPPHKVKFVLDQEFAASGLYSYAGN